MMYMDVYFAGNISQKPISICNCQWMRDCRLGSSFGAYLCSVDEDLSQFFDSCG